MTRFKFTIAALVLVIMIGGQLAVSGYSAFEKLRGNTQAIHWQTFPFYDYPMYSKASGPPVTTDVPRLYAEFADGSRTEVNWEMTGLRYFAWRFNVLERLVADPIATDHVDQLDAAEAEELRAVAQLVEAHRLEAAANAMHKVMRARGRDDRPLRFVVERDVYLLEGREMKRSEATQVYDIPDDLEPSASLDDEASPAAGDDHE